LPSPLSAFCNVYVLIRSEGSGYGKIGEERLNEAAEFRPLGLGKKEDRELEDGGEPFGEELLAATELLEDDTIDELS
jgi:hypothetical protein